MRYPSDTWIEVVATCLMEAVEAWFSGESQCIETGARRAWRSWAAFSQEMIVAFEPMTEMEVARRQIIELRQTSCVLGYIQRFRILRYKIPEHDRGGSSLAVSSRIGCRASAAGWCPCTIVAGSHGAGRAC